jgi:hypothetical protein
MAFDWTGSEVAWRDRVEQLRAVFRQHDITRRQVVVHDALRVRRIQRCRDLNCVLQGTIERQPPSLPSRVAGVSPSRS